MSMQKIQGSVKIYIIGLVVCMLLTVVPYYLVVRPFLFGWHAIAAVIGLAIIQVFVQLILFLHLGDEEHPRWNLMAFLFMALVLVIVVFGSLWIMYNLEQRTMPTMEYMRAHEGM